jgi:cytochrome P450
MVTPPTSSKYSGQAVDHRMPSFICLRNYFARPIERLLSTPWIMRPLFNLLRQWRPILLANGNAIVTKYRDVRAVLADAEHFDVDYPKAGQHQIVAMRDGPEYRNLKDSLLHGLGSDYQSQLRTIVTNRAERALSAMPKRFDAVSQYARVIAIDLTDSFLGVPANPEDMQRWTRTILRDIFLNLLNDPKMSADAQRSRMQLAAHVAELLTRAKADLDAGGQPPDNFFGRLLTHARATQTSDDVVRDLMAGLVTALADNISNTISRSMKFLLDHPLQLNGAADAATENNSALLLRYILEALRFNPESPLLLRLCSNAVTLAPMTSRLTTIPAGTMVMAAIEGAMFDSDPEAFPEPRIFRTTRPLDNYLHFGWGMHRCFGMGIAEVVLPAAVGALLRLPNLRRVRGFEGLATYDGTFPTRMLIEYG